MFKYLFRKTAKPLIRDAAEVGADVAGADVRAAATSAAHGAINTESRDVARIAAEDAARASTDTMTKQAVGIARESNAPARITAYLGGGAKILLALGSVGGSIYSIWRVEQVGRELGNKASKLGEDLLQAVHNDTEAAVQALKSVPEGLTEGLNVSGPIKTLIQTGSAAVMVGGVIFTVYGTYRLFR